MVTEEQQVFLENLGKCIAKTRKGLLLSQSDLGGLIDMEVPYLSSIENGRQNPTALTLLKIAKGLNVPVSSLFHEADKI
jgi:transcriptional regulator with XRE-family HTH domain